MMETKESLRLSLRKARQAIHKKQNYWDVCDTSAFQYVAERLSKNICVAGYIAIGSEVDPAPLLALAAEKGGTLALPFLADRAAPMEFRQWTIGAALENAAFGFAQPSADASATSPDVIFVPLVGFDRAMHRLGQGAGHYDRAFPAFPRAVRIGLAWSVQEVNALPVDAWDVTLDFILTERELISAATPRIIET
jgi:5-formyltetrahydrofolate cyclo-ligase